MRHHRSIGAPIVGYTPSATISVLPHLLIDHDQAAIEGYLGEATEDGGQRPYMMAHAVYSTVRAISANISANISAVRARSRLER